MNIPLFKIHTDEADVEAVAAVIRRGGYWAIGPEIEAFEKQLAEYVGVKYAVAMNSGTSALHAALLALGVQMGDEVIVPSFTFIATANAVVMCGAKPVFAEIEGVTYGLDPKDVARKITSRTKVVMPVHYGGGVCRGTAELVKLCQDKGLWLVEDAAESLGATIKGKKVGGFGVMGCISLCAPKVITTGEGGAVLTDDQTMYSRLLRARSHGRLDDSKYFSSPNQGQYVELGYNYRMSSMTAALASAQLTKIGRIIARRQANADVLSTLLHYAGIEHLPYEPTGTYGHVYQMFTIRVDAKHRDGLKKHLNEAGIGAKVYFDPIHLTMFYKGMGWKDGDLPETERISREVLTLPMYPDLTAEEIEYMAEKVREYFNG
jgi:dTDP-4-amino-4,6-dideoxygalactose transaminase